MTYDASSESKRTAIKAGLSRKGYNVTDSPARMAFPYPVRVWGVDAADEEAVVRAIKAIDSGARPVVPPPSSTHS